MKLINAQTLAELLCVSPKTIYDWVYKNRIPHHKLGSLLRFSEDEIDNWLKKKRRVATNKRNYNHDRDKRDIS